MSTKVAQLGNMEGEEARMLAKRKDGARQMVRGILCFRASPGGKHTLGFQNSLFGASCVFPMERREFYNHLCVKRFLPIIGEKSF